MLVPTVATKNEVNFIEDFKYFPDKTIAVCVKNYEFKKDFTIIIIYK